MFAFKGGCKMIKTNKSKRRRLKVGRVIFVSLIMWLSILGAISLFNPSKASSIDKKEYKNYTIEQLSRLLGYSEQLLLLKLENRQKY